MQTIHVRECKGGRRDIYDSQTTVCPLAVVHFHFTFITRSFTGILKTRPCYSLLDYVDGVFASELQHDCDGRGHGISIDWNTYKPQLLLKFSPVFIRLYFV